MAKEKNVGRTGRKERIGILGGAFDPIHEGHIRMALGALKYAGLDRVLIIPSGSPPHKRDVTSAEIRWQMVVTACTVDKRLEPCRLELEREGTDYTFDTLSTLIRQYPKAEFFFIIGLDQMLRLEYWYRAEEIIRMCTFLVCPRATDLSPAEINSCRKHLQKLGAQLDMIDMEPVTVSSSEIRAQLAAGVPSPHLPLVIREYCGCRGLYGMPKRIERADEWFPKLFVALKPSRFAHSLGAAYTCRHLAGKHGINPVQAEEAGLLHDCAKCFSLQKMQEIAVTHSLTADQAILSDTGLLHARVGAWVARAEYGMADPSVLEAITWHNTGKAGMTPLDVLVCLADAIEPTRKDYPLLERIRLLSVLSLPKALLLSLESTSEYVKTSGKYLHPQTEATIAWLKSETEKNLYSGGPT